MSAAFLTTFNYNMLRLLAITY